MSLGSNIKRARNHAGLTQRQLGVACGWGDEAQTRISKYENEEREPSLEHLRQIAKATKTSIHVLIEEEGDSEVEEIMTYLYSAGPERRRGVLGMLRSFFDNF